MFARFPKRLIALAALLAAPAGSLMAQTAVTWTQGVTGNWKTTGNWTGLVPPDLFPNNGANTYTVTIPGVGGQPNTTTVIFDNTTIAGNSIAISGLTLSSALNALGNNSAELVLGPGVVLSAGNLTNFSGTTLSGGRYFLDGTLRFNGANVQTLAAGTTLIMNGPSAQILNQATAVNALSAFTTNNGIFDIRNGYTFNAASGWNNSGTVSVSEGALYTTTGNYTNSGVLLASGSSGTGTIFINGALTNTGGTLNAANNGVINIVNAQVSNGTLTTSGNGRITFNNTFANVLYGTTVNGTLDLATSNGTTRIEQGMVLGANGVININNGSGVSLRGNNTISGSGSIVFGSTGNNTLAVDISNSVATIGAGVTIRGHSGRIGPQFYDGTAGSSIVNNGLISADMNGGTIDVTQATVTNNNILEGANGGTLQLSSGVTNSATGQLRATNNGVVRLNGVTVSGGTVNTSTGGKITMTSNPANVFDNVTVNGAVDVSAATSSNLRVTNTLTLGGGTFTIDNGSGVSFTGNTFTNGTGSFTFGANGSNQVAVDVSNSTFTIGAGTLIHGMNGSVGAQRHNGSAGTIVANNGTISADGSGGTISLNQATFNNNNLLEARSGGTLNIATTVNNTANGKVNADVNGIVVLNNNSINGGTVGSTGNGRFTATGSSNNFLNDVTVNGNIDLATATGGIRVAGTTGMNLQGTSTVNLNNGSILAFQGNQTLSGTGSVIFGSSLISKVAVDQSGSVFTVGSGATIRGHTGVIGAQAHVGTAGASILNNGRISADVNGGTLEIVQATVTNNGILEAKNGGTLRLSSNVTGNSGSQISAGANSVVLQNGVTLSGIINSTGTGSLRPTNSSANFLDAVTLTGTLDLATSTGNDRSVNGLTLNGTVKLDNGSSLMFHDTQTLSGNGTVILGSNNSSRVGVDVSNAVVTFGPNVTIRGENGTIGNQLHVGTANSSIINNGRISADVAGGTIEMLQATVTNNGIMEALNGGTLKLSSNVTAASAGQFQAGANSVILQNGVTVTGTINTSGSGAFRATNSSNNYFDAATINGTVDLAAAQSSERVINGLVLNGNINLNNNSVLAFQGTQTLSGSGTINLGNLTNNNRVALDGSNSVLTIANGVKIRGENGVVGTQHYLGTAGSVVVNNSIISADVAGGTISLQQADFTNNNTLEARNGGTLNVATNVTSSAAGKVDAHNNGVVLLNGVTMTGGSVNTSSGGAFRATISSNNFMNNVTVNGNLDLASQQSGVRVVGGMTLGSGGVVSINNNSAYVFQGNTTLNGTGQVVFGNTAGNRLGLDVSNSTLTIGSGVTVRGENGTIGNQLHIGSANTHLVNNGTIKSDGGGLITIATGQLADVTNNGTFRAENGTFTNGLTVTGTGTLQIDATGTMNMANAGGGNTQDRLIMGAAGATLNTNNHNITINKDYTNVGAGVGNAFDRRAGITGTGQILAGANAAQAITGANVTNGATTNASLTIGNVRVGTTNFAYNIANTGVTGPDLRGAIQTSVNGGNITDARLGGSGVTASNYGPAPTGTTFGPLNVGFTAASAGVLAPLNGQAVNLRSNFENIADQKLNIVLAAGAAAYNVAVGSAATPVNLGNTRVGGTLSGNVNVSNTAPAAFSEKLDATFGANTGQVSNNGGSISLLTAGTSNNTSMGVSLNTATSGAKTGTATLNYVSNGNGTSGLGTIAAGSQAVTVNGNVYQAAIGQLNGTALNFGTVQVGQNVSQVLSITNAATGAAGFVEDLNASFGAKAGTGTSLFNGTGSIAGLLAGSTNNSAMTVSVNTSSAGTVNGTIAVNYFSAGAVNNVSNGLGVLAVGSSPFSVNGNIQAVANVVNQASPVINNSPINLGNVRLNAASPVGLVSVTNQATTPPQAALNATIAGNGAITATGSFNLLNPGSTNNSSLQVGMNTSSAGSKNGTATLGFVSDASNIGNCAPNCQLTLASQNVNVTGAVYRLANPTLSGSPVNLVARVGDASPTATLGVTNTSPDAFTERLDASFNGAAPTGFTTSGSIVGLAAQASSSALTVGLNTATAGSFNGNASINLISSGAGTTNAADMALTPGSASLNGKVYTKAVGQLNTNAVNFGIVHVGDVVGAKNVSVTNGAAVTALNDVLTGDISGGSSPFSVSGTLGSGVAAGNTNVSSLNVGLNTATAGVYSGNASVNFKSHNADMTDLTLGSSNVSLSGTVNNYASAAFAKSAGLGSFNFQNGSWVLDFGSVQAGSSNVFATLGVRNTAAGPADVLNGDFSFGAGNGFGFTGFNLFTGIGAGSMFGNLGVLLNTTSVGLFSQTVSLDWFGSNASGYVGNTSTLQLTVTGNVTNVAPPTTVPEPSTFVLMIGGLAAVAYARKRRTSR